MEKELEKYLMLCAVYNMGDGFVAAYDIDNPPIEADHLKSMGGRHIPYMDFMEMLNPKAIDGRQTRPFDISYRHGHPLP